MIENERFAERRSTRNSKFWRNVAIGVAGVTAAGVALGINSAVEDTNKVEAQDISEHVLELNNAVANADRGINSQAEVDALKAKLGDSIDLRVVETLQHTGVKPAGDSVVVDESSPMAEIQWSELKEHKSILLGSVHYEGPMTAAKLIAVGPDGKEFFKDTEGGDAVDMVNPILVPTKNGLDFYGASGTEVIRISISYDGLLRTVTNEGQGFDQIQPNKYKLTVNGLPLSVSSFGMDKSKKGERVVTELEAKADDFIVAVSATNDTVGLGINPGRRAVGEIDRIVRSGQVKVGEIISGATVALDSPRSITFTSTKPR